ncbi:DUF4389 domain-containing protein [Gilvimarinus sp. DA14]|uniref:DUF4389 domain-containing protein n=1 Tax=Gilvimarinus sp. DA14 TaxID=2956798 RepID=UPI0020B8C4A4|nr:DUF4389 domain-containing protein [Gilvimarinus sp. DA14]UTF61006.1 DUF4389 domain-containing protein [Gilvimarinus sp. DA14]
MDNDQLKSNLLSADHWMRFVYMILFAVILYIAGIVMGIVVLIQFVFALITGSDNSNLRQLGDSLSQYIYAALRFLTYNSEEKPFPFADWPEPAPVAEAEVVVEPSPAPVGDTPAPHSEEPAEPPVSEESDPTDPKPAK